ncbi:MAG: hypothetical protein KF784_12510 [Fimbriimonadaceae bacterium]|nr:hypothetical protein [Fimbriimonadaceae bacterium]
MSLAKRIILWSLILGAILIVAVNYQTIKDKIVGFKDNAAYMREAREAGSKYVADIFTNWNFENLQSALDPSVQSSWSAPENGQKFAEWNGTYGSVTQKRVSVALKPGEGTKVDFKYRAEMQCAYKNALLVLTLRRNGENDWRIVDIAVGDLPATAEQFN